MPYTFIDVGFWMQITVPPRVGTEGPSANRLREWYGEGNQKTAVVNLSSIGGFVARIIADPRTLNQYVFMCDDEVTMTEVYSIVSQISGEDLHKVKVEVSRSVRFTSRDTYLLNRLARRRSSDVQQRGRPSTRRARVYPRARSGL